MVGYAKGKQCLGRDLIGAMEDSGNALTACAWLEIRETSLMLLSARKKVL